MPILPLGHAIADRFQIKAVLHASPTTTVYDCLELPPSRRVAVKVRPTPKDGRPFTLAREAQLGSGLPLAPLASYLDSGPLPDGEEFLAMEYLDGITLRKRLEKTGPMTPQDLVPILLPGLTGLGALHEAGVVHRNLTSAHVFLLQEPAGSGNSVTMLDLSRALVGRADGSGAVVGTPSYLSPEQVLGRMDVDLRADLYAVGVILYEAASGKLPFAGESLFQLAARILTESPVPLSTLAPGLDPGFVALVEKAMARDPKARFQTAAEFTQALSPWLPAEAAGPAGAASTGVSATPPVADGSIWLRVAASTDPGQVRSVNEDAFFAAELGGQGRDLQAAREALPLGSGGILMAVCDGLGGAVAGEFASRFAVDAVLALMREKPASTPAPESREAFAGRLVQSLEVASERLFTRASSDPSLKGAGTTVTVAGLLDDHLFLGQVGDSRGYLLRDRQLVQVTRDQSLVNQLIEAGQLTEEEAETFEHNNIILQAFGTSSTVKVDLTYVELRRGDVLLLCSDGVSGMIRYEEIRGVLETVRDPGEACRALIAQANAAGGHDNITCIVARFDGPGLKVRSAGDSILAYRKYNQLPVS